MKDGLTSTKIDQLLARLKPHPVVALVDDDSVTLDLLSRTFKEDGYEIHRFEKAEDFLEKFHEIKPDAVIMEAVLPGMSGLAALEEIRPKKVEEVIPVLILSQKDDLRTKLLAFRRGASDYVTKPFQSEEVGARMKALLRAHLLQQLLEEGAFSDPLTSLYSQRFLMDWLNHEMDRVKRYSLDLSCMIFGLDHFHQITEKNGQRFSDYLLGAFADLMAHNARKSDIVGRTQNDEFIVFLPGTSKEQAINVAKRLRKAAGESRFELSGKEVQPTFCVGITGCHAAEAAPPETFLNRARQALRLAQSVGEGETVILGLEE